MEKNCRKEIRKSVYGEFICWKKVLTSVFQGCFSCHKKISSLKVQRKKVVIFISAFLLIFFYFLSQSGTYFITLYFYGGPVVIFGEKSQGKLTNLTLFHKLFSQDFRTFNILFQGNYFQDFISEFFFPTTF